MQDYKTKYKNGTPFEDYEKVKKNIQRFIIRKNNKKPVFIVIDGASSSGKTTLAIHLADLINKEHGLPEIEISKESIQLGTYSEDFIKKLTKAGEKGYPVIIFDEGGEYNKRGWATKLNRILDRVMDTFRAYKIIIIFILHDMNELPQHIWNIKLPTCLIHLKERPDNKKYGISMWYDLKSMYYIKHYRRTDIFPEASYDKVYPNFRTKFLDLPPERSKALDTVSTTHKKQDLIKKEIELQGLLSYEDIHQQIGMSIIWIKKKIKELKILPERIFKKRKYFNQTIINRLQQKIKKQ